MTETDAACFEILAENYRSEAEVCRQRGDVARLLHMCGHEGVSALLGILRCLFIVDQVMPENVARLFRRSVEDMGSAGIDDDLEIGLARDGLTFAAGVQSSFSPIIRRTGTDGSTPS